MISYQEILKQYWGYDDFRGIQREIIESIGSGHDTLGLMPTGGGKSITFQVPALCQDGTCIVITPLIALMKDQVDNLRRRGIRAAAIYSGLTREEIVITLENCIFGDIRILYVSPERLASDLFQTKLRHMRVSFITVDEAHCISQWGYDFRPSYLHISDIRKLWPQAPVLALTATATPEVVEDIQRRLEFREPNVIRMSFERRNLTYVVRHTEDKSGELVHILSSMPGSAIVYTRNRKATGEYARLLKASGITALNYHAGLTRIDKELRQKSWNEGETRVMVATNAFGMGIDKSNVGFVVHYNLPLSMEAYYQEAGRAGRDGTPATCLLLYSPADLHTAEFLISRTTRDDLTEQEERDLIAHDERRLADMVRYATSTGCLRHQILAYFGEDAPATCDNCSNCRTSWQEVDRTVDALKVVSCVARLAQRRRTVGAGTIAKILRGSTDQKTLDNGFDTLSTYGIMSDVPAAGIHDLISELVARGILARSEGAYPVIELTDASGPFLRAASQAGERFIVRVAREEPGKKNKRPGRERPSLHDGLRGGGTATEPTAPDGDSLYERLRAVRTELAREQGVPPYIICSNATLEDMCRVHPRTAEELLDVSGIGESKARRYGERFLAVLLEE